MHSFTARVALAIALATALGAAPVAAQDKVVYHFSEGLEQAVNGLRNIRNHLEVDPKAQITAVAHARGVDFLMNDAKDKGGYPFQLTVEQLKAQGVRFEVCEITLRNRQLKREQFIGEASFVPSGVQRITQLQAREGFAYLKP